MGPELQEVNKHVTVVGPNPGLDGASRSYWVKNTNEKQKLVHSSWLIKVPQEEQPQDQDQDA